MDQQLAELLKNVVKNPGISPAFATGVFSELHLTPPVDYLPLLLEINGCEGFVGPSYIRLYPVEKLVPLNTAYQFHKFAPGLVLFGSTGGGEAFAFDTRTTRPAIVQIPFIPLDLQYAASLGQTIHDFLVSRVKARSDNPRRHAYKVNPSTFGMEVHEIQPVVFGGDPVDSKNKVLVPPEEHAKLSVFWNDVYQSHKSKSGGD